MCLYCIASFFFFFFFKQKTAYEMRISDWSSDVCSSDLCEQRAQVVLDDVGAHPGDEREAAGDAIRVERLAQGEHLVSGHGGADLAADRVADATEELDVGAVELAGPLTDPEHVGRAVVPLAGEGVLAGERFLVAEDQRLVAREEVDLVEVGLGL